MASPTRPHAHLTGALLLLPGGTYYKGTVVNVRQQQPPYHSPMEVKEAYDPWEALEVEWDVGGGHAAAHGNDCERISPWELESDPDEDARREEEKKKEAEASARAARAARGARRCARLPLCACRQPVTGTAVCQSACVVGLGLGLNLGIHALGKGWYQCCMRIEVERYCLEVSGQITSQLWP